MCFQNLFFGGPVIVVLEKHSPWKCRLFSPAEDVLLGGGCIYTKEIQCSKHFAVFTDELNEIKYLCRWNKAAIVWWSTLLTCSFCEPVMEVVSHQASLL